MINEFFPFDAGSMLTGTFGAQPSLNHLLCLLQGILH
jgi:hypothetical protein